MLGVHMGSGDCELCGMVMVGSSQVRMVQCRKMAVCHGDADSVVRCARRPIGCIGAALRVFVDDDANARCYIEEQITRDVRIAVPVRRLLRASR